MRAIAVLSVVFFHAFPNWIQGGFIGVDIFFVISGFLISTIIYDSLERNSFSFVEFYSRRIKRIFPTLLLVLIACFAFGWFALLADEYKQLGKHIAGGAGFVSNFVFWNESGYFDNASGTKPLLHLWSLGIEEQFYILWPLLLWLAWKKRFNLLTITIVIGLMSFALNLGHVRSDAVAAFYSPQTRFWELLAGSVLAYITLYKQTVLAKFKHRLDAWLGAAVYAHAPQANGNTLRNVQSLIGIAMIAAGVLFITKERHFPGWWAVLPTVGAVLIISAGAQAWLNRAVLSNRVLVWFGLISFPLYLWHWPLLSFARIIESETPAREIRIVAVVISIALAWLTYKLIEKPMRFGKHSKMKTITLLVLMVVVGYAGYNSYKRDGLEFRVKNFVKITKAAGEWQYPGDLKTFIFKDRSFYYKKSEIARTTLFIGDSNIEQYYVRIDELIKTHPSSTNSVIFSTGGGCAPIPNVRIDTHKHCFDLLEKSLELAISRDDISTVVIGGQWYGYLSGSAPRYFAKEGQKLPIEKGSVGYYNALSALSNYIKVLKLNKKRVFLILNMPIGKELDPKFMAQRSIKNFPMVLKIQDGGISLKTLEEKYGFIKSDLTEIAYTNQIILIDPIKYLCKNDICPSVDMENEPIYKDAAHLRPYFVRSKADFIDLTVSN